MIVTLDVPDRASFQLVYRTERTTAFGVAPPADAAFAYLTSAASGAEHFGAVAGYCGKLGAVKALAKLASARRSLYVVTSGGVTVSAGWCTVGLCKYYKIEPDAVVVGPIWTAESARGKGLATVALRLALDHLIRSGRTIFYIDTEKQNLPAQRVIDKCGFGRPVALYLR